MLPVDREACNERTAQSLWIYRSNRRTCPIQGGSSQDQRCPKDGSAHGSRVQDACRGGQTKWLGEYAGTCVPSIPADSSIRQKLDQELQTERQIPGITPEASVRKTTVQEQIRYSAELDNKAGMYSGIILPVQRSAKEPKWCKTRNESMN